MGNRETIVGVLNENTDLPDGWTEIVSTPYIDAGDYVENLGFVGKRLDGRKVIVVFENALCTSGFDLGFKNKESSILKATFECYADLSDDPTTLPYHVYVED